MSGAGTTAHAVNVRGYLMVFGALLLLTVVTVAIAELDFGARTTVIVAVAIAAVKATLVALFFMHLKSERAAVYWPLGLTAVLFAALFAFVLWTEGDRLFGTRFTDAFGTEPKPASPPQGGH